ncbi:putative ATP-dependent RNA helicase DDX43-like protein [Dinothrombium tinctorium]|nr:putative ATP-dependent RNA helicase DDX43-like protein [Dinothrombium tinctorium]
MMSATWPEGVRRLAVAYMKDPMQIFVGTLDLAACHSVTQNIIMTTIEEKRSILYDFVDKMKEDDKVIVFVDKKVMADELSSEFALKDIICQCIHGDRDQSDREQALQDLRSGEVHILIATDVASRGLDIEDITHIFNYDFPRNVEEYVHRIGRTGRAGREGESITLVTREDWKHAGELIKILQEANQEVPGALVAMSERYAEWKARYDAEIEACGGRRPRRGGGGFGGGGFGGGRRNKW